MNHLTEAQIRARGATQCECDGRCGTSHAPADAPAGSRWRCQGHHGMWRPGRPLMTLTVAETGTGPRRARMLLCPDCITSQ